MELPVSTSPKTFKIGTRGSPLALAQAHETRDRLMRTHDLPETAFEIIAIKTTGDIVLDRPLGEIGGKGLFTKEIEEALLDGSIDCAVHSMKDMPVEQPDGLILDCYLPREDTRDAFLALGGGTLMDLPQGATVGSSSLRRRAQIAIVRPDIKLVEFRGNVQTRLRKLNDGVADATLLAMAGLRRLGLDTELPINPIPDTNILPAVAQGAIGIEWRRADDATAAMISPLNDADTHTRLAAERAFLAGLDGSCQTPIASLAELDGDQLYLRGQVIRPDGSEEHHAELRGPASTAADMGAAMAETLRAKMSTDFFH